MATSDFNTPSRIIKFAMDNAGLLAAGNDPTPEQFVKYLNRLNDLVNLWQTQGLKLWLNSMLNVNLTAGAPSYSLGVVKRVLEGHYVDTTTTPNVTRPLEQLSWERFNSLNALGAIPQQGTVTSFFVNKALSGAILNLWMCPDATAAANGRLLLLVQNPVANIVTLTEQVAFPNEWYMALHWGLAAEICTGQPEQIVQRCEKRAEAYRSALEDWDVEDASITFQPDMRMHTPSKFR